MVPLRNELRFSVDFASCAMRLLLESRNRAFERGFLAFGVAAQAALQITAADETRRRES